MSSSYTYWITRSYVRTIARSLPWWSLIVIFTLLSITATVARWNPWNSAIVLHGWAMNQSFHSAAIFNTLHAYGNTIEATYLEKTLSESVREEIKNNANPKLPIEQSLRVWNDLSEIQPTATIVVAAQAAYSWALRDTEHFVQFRDLLNKTNPLATETIILNTLK